MKLIKQFFINIGRDDIDENVNDFLKDDMIDSIDIMDLVTEIEKYYKKPLDPEFVKAKNFKNFQTIKNMINEAMK